MRLLAPIHLVCAGFVVSRHGNGQGIETIKEHDANNHHSDYHIMGHCNFPYYEDILATVICRVCRLEFCAENGAK
jgi:hypothetical protein